MCERWICALKFRTNNGDEEVGHTELCMTAAQTTTLRGYNLTSLSYYSVLELTPNAESTFNQMAQLTKSLYGLHKL